MLNSRRSLRAAAISSVLAAVGASSVLFAQEQAPTTVGPPALKDFQLQGERTTPAQPTPAGPEIAPSAPAVQLPRSTTTIPILPRTQPAAERPAATPAPTRTTPRPAPRAVEPAPGAQPVPSTQPASPAPTAATPVEAAPSPAAPVVAPAPAAPTTAAPQAAPAAPAGNDSAWLWVAVPAVFALLAFFGLGRRRRRTGAERAEQTVATSPAATATRPRPAPAVPVPAPSPRARLEIEFRADRAAATGTEARVHFDMVLRNVGDIEARNIRIDSRMFNADAERDIDTFVKGPIHDLSGSPHVTILPGDTLELASMLSLPKSEMHEIKIQGRRVFVPVVAINVAYDWADGGKGRTSRSWLVGREADQPSAKMGAFRLDLGPRIYRSVGQRPMRLANVA